MNFCLFFVDDGNLADFDTMCNVLQFIEEKGEKFGYRINKEKGSYCMGKCENFETACERQQHLVQLGLSSDIMISSTFIPTISLKSPSRKLTMRRKNMA